MKKNPSSGYQIKISLITRTGISKKEKILPVLRDAQHIYW
jgi:hypothetical protein